MILVNPDRSSLRRLVNAGDLLYDFDHRFLVGGRLVPNLRLAHFMRPRGARGYMAGALLLSFTLIAAAALYLILARDEANPLEPNFPLSTPEEKIELALKLPASAIDAAAQPAHQPPPAPDKRAERHTLQAFAQLLAQQNFESAVDAYDQIYTRSSIEFSSAYHELILDHASDLIQHSHAALAVALLRQYVDIYFSDVQALIMLGQAYRETGAKFAAIQSLQQAYLYEHRSAVSELILDQANTIIGEYVQQLKEAKDQQTVVDVYQYLTAAQPGVSGYFIGLAKAYVAQQRYAEAAAALRYVKYDVKVGRQARSLLQELAAEHNI